MERLFFEQWSISKQNHSKVLLEVKQRMERVLGSDHVDFGKSSQTDSVPIEIPRTPGLVQVPRQLEICKSQGQSGSGRQGCPRSK